ncbi:MAG: toprim domain-containing protein [Candidatus Aenigmarchaeota archaeon]|nr:toprim domain-containing protein [Candidatus Aenigmarchaeota archaeon]MCX8179180.1 toprim domain-containing protein [Candidatus Aenigmarchaeota archaeon]
MFITHDHEKLISRLQHYLIIVEGKNDKKALEAFNLNNIITISGKSIEKFILELPKTSEYVVLTDFDREGELKKKRIYRFFEMEKIKYNPELRKEFKSTFRVAKIEELNKWGDIYGENSSIYNKILNRSKFHRRRCRGKT